jgi:hypothetical protein
MSPTVPPSSITHTSGTPSFPSTCESEEDVRLSQRTFSGLIVVHGTLHEIVCLFVSCSPSPIILLFRWEVRTHRDVRYPLNPILNGIGDVRYHLRENNPPQRRKQVGRHSRRPLRVVYGANHRAGQLGETGLLRPFHAAQSDLISPLKG